MSQTKRLLVLCGLLLQRGTGVSSSLHSSQRASVRTFSTCFTTDGLARRKLGFRQGIVATSLINVTAAPTATLSAAAAEKTSASRSQGAKQMHSKVVIIGSGPAAHTAAVYLSRAMLAPVMYEGFLANGFAAGGQLTTTTDVENYPGFPDGIGGMEMMDLFRKQSIRFGTTIITETVSKVDLSQRPFRYWLEDKENEEGNTCDALVLGTGAAARRMHVPGEEVYWQRGISACAVCDGAGPFFRNKILAVVGGGDSAAEEALFLTRYAHEVKVLVRRDKLRASKVMAKRLESNPKVEILWNTVVVEAKGDNKKLTALRLRDTVTGEERDESWNDLFGGLFYAIGHEPASALVKGQLELDADGYVITNPDSTVTSVEGVFAAGDVQDKKYRQAVTSAGSGCMAALECERWLSEKFGE